MNPATATLAVDWTRCAGHGLCAVLLAGRIDRDEWGYPIVPDAAVTDRRAARRAVAACPALALRLQPGPAASRDRRQPQPARTPR